MSYVSGKFSRQFFTRNRFLWTVLLVLGQLPVFSQNSQSNLGPPSVYLTWNPSTNANVAGYKIYFGGASGIYTNSFAVGTATNVNVYGLIPGATYYFSAVTVSASGQESLFSNEASYVIPLGSQPPTLNAIANLTILATAGPQTVNLSGISPGTGGNSTVNVYAVSDDNGAIISPPAVNYANPNSTGTLTFTPTGVPGTADVTVTVDNGGVSNNPTSETFTVTVLPAPPTLGPISNVTIYQNAGLQTVNLTGISAGTSGNPTVNIYAISSDNGEIITPPVVNYANPNSAGTLTFAPANQTGTATVTVTVDNGGASNNPTSQSFTVTVLAVPQTSPPSLAAITNVTVYENSGLQTVNLSGISPGTSGGPSVDVYAVSSDNGAIITPPTINYTNPSPTGTLTFTPIANALGTATVTVTVNNGGTSNNPTSQTFTVTVVPAPPTLDPIPNVIAYQNFGMQTVNLAGITAGTSGNSTVNVYAISDDGGAIISAPVVNYANPNSTGTLTFTPTGAPGTADVTVIVDNGGVSNNPTSRTFTVTVLPLQPPTIGAVANMVIFENSGLQTVTLVGITPGLSDLNPAMTVSAVSSNPSLIPAPVVNYSSGNNFATLAFAPAPDTLGSATVTVTVNNGAASNNITTMTFGVTVVVPPGGNPPPTLNPLANLTMLEDGPMQNVTLTGIAGTATQREMLRVSASSSNQRLVTPMLRYTSPDSTGLLTLRPGPNEVGTATITVTVNNGGKSNNIVRQSFTVTVLPISPPTLDPVANVTVAQNAGPQTILLTGITAGSNNIAQTLRIGATVSSPRLISEPRIQYTSPSNTALLTFNPSTFATGTATVTVTVSDNNRVNNQVRQRFTVSVIPSVTNVVPDIATADLTAKSNAATRALATVQNTAANLTSVVQANGQFSFQVSGVPGGRYAVQATSDFVHWASLVTNTAPFVFQESSQTAGQRFYRALYLQ